MSKTWGWNGGSRRQADKVRWSQKVMEMGQGTDKGGKRQERKEGRSYHDTMLPAMWQGVMPATAASPSQCRRWGSLPQTGSQPATGRLSLLTPSENYQSLKDTMPSLW